MLTVIPCLLRLRRRLLTIFRPRLKHRDSDSAIAWNAGRIKPAFNQQGFAAIVIFDNGADGEPLFFRLALVVLILTGDNG